MKYIWLWLMIGKLKVKPLLLASPSETEAYSLQLQGKAKIWRMQDRGHAQSIVFFLISGHSGVLVNARGNTDRSRAIVPLS